MTTQQPTQPSLDPLAALVLELKAEIGRHYHPNKLEGPPQLEAVLHARVLPLVQAVQAGINIGACTDKRALRAALAVLTEATL